MKEKFKEIKKKLIFKNFFDGSCKYNGIKYFQFNQKTAFVLTN